MAKKPQKEKPRTDGSITFKDPKWELFCWLYVGYHSRSLFGNGTQCYLEAYGGNKEIEELDDEIVSLRELKEKGYTAEVARCEARILSLQRTAKTNGNRLLSKAVISKRCDFLLRSLCNNEFMDQELSYVAGQRHDLASKVAAIREYNSMKNRSKKEDPNNDVHITFGWEDPEPRPGKKPLVKSVIKN